MQPHISNLDLPSRKFQPRVYGVGAWTAHLHFGYDLVAALRPRLLVELGVDRGESFFAFCQSAQENNTGTRAVAVDTWEGDQHAGGYDETTFAEVSAHHAAHYAGFATLRRSTFAAALPEFAAGSIDLLHVDGLHTEDAVQTDLDAWLPKLRPGGILLLHDVGVRQPGFGVWKVWEELQTRGRSWTFTDGPGLGLWQKPPAVLLPPLLETLLTAPNESSDALREYYSTRAREMEEQIARAWQDGSIRSTPFARQTVVQVFHTTDGTHRPEHTASIRIGHDEWKDAVVRLPEGAGAAPLRIDFVSALSIVEIESISIKAAGRVCFTASPEDVTVAGDAERLPSPAGLRLRITGVDPQLHLPVVQLPPDADPVEVHLRLRVEVPKP
jgi:SAM-dependent methyltransferase